MLTSNQLIILCVCKIFKLQRLSDQALVDYYIIFSCNETERLQITQRGFVLRVPQLKVCAARFRATLYYILC